MFCEKQKVEFRIAMLQQNYGRRCTRTCPNTDSTFQNSKIKTLKQPRRTQASFNPCSRKLQNSRTGTLKLCTALQNTFFLKFSTQPSTNTTSTFQFTLQTWTKLVKFCIGQKTRAICFLIPTQKTLLMLWPIYISLRKIMVI